MISKEELKWLIDLGKGVLIWSESRAKYNDIIAKLTQQPTLDSEFIKKPRKTISIKDDDSLNDIDKFSFDSDIEIIFRELLDDWVNDDLINDEWFNTKIDKLQQAFIDKDNEIEKLNSELKEYENISIGLDFGYKDNSAISIMQLGQDSAYCLYSKTFPAGSGKSIKLSDLIKQKEIDLMKFKEETK